MYFQLTVAYSPTRERIKSSGNLAGLPRAALGEARYAVGIEA
jgi:hypothetical protein